MQFDWTTFALEVVNFLVLVWVLKRFLYRPVMDVLDARQERVKGEMARSEQLRQTAESLKQQYETRLADWTREREQARLLLEQEMTELRGAGMENIKKSLSDEEAKARARGAATITSREADLVRQATGEAYNNAAAMLRRLASPELTMSIVHMLLEDLATLPSNEQAVLLKAGMALGDSATAEIVSAHPLEEKTLAEISQALSVATGKSLNIVFKLAPELIAGLRVAIGECLLHANLAEELIFFRRQGKNA